MFDLRASCAVRELVSAHLFTDQGIEQEIRETVPGTVNHALLEMKRALLAEQVIKEAKDLWGKKPEKVDSNRCGRCGVLFYYEQSTSSNICPQCGHVVFVLENQLVSFHSTSRYNRNPIHIYAKHEHFFQTLVDMTCMGRRKVDNRVVVYCAAVLGRGLHVTFDKVFDVLQAGGFQRSYCNKYEIAARLRGRPEIVLSSRETELVRCHYIRYDRCFYEFQVAHKIGNRTRSGRLRLFWPVRFIIAEMFKLIDRHDLVASVRKIAGKKRLTKYIRYWNELRKVVDRRAPFAVSHPPLKLTRLPRPMPRVKYSRPQGPRPQVQPSSSSRASAGASSSRPIQT